MWTTHGALSLLSTLWISWDKRQLLLSKQPVTLLFVRISALCIPLIDEAMWLCRQVLEILAHPAVRKRRVPMLIACNKSDEGAKAHTVDFVRKRVEREM